LPVIERGFLLKEVEIEEEPAENDKEGINDEKDGYSHGDISEGNEDDIDRYQCRSKD